MTISRRLLGELLKGCARPEDLPGDAGLMKEFEIRLMEWMPGAEPTAHSGHEEGKDSPPGQPNRRNGTSARRRKGQDSETPVSVPRDRDGSFEAELVKAGQTRIDGMDDKIIGLCAAGLTVRDIRAHPEDVRGLQVRPGLPLGHCCAMPCRAADQPGQRRRAGRDPRMAGPGAGAHVSDCDLRRAQGQDPRCRLPHGQEQGCPCGLSMWPFAMGLGPMAAPWLTVSRDGVREVPGLWIAGNEGARFWLSVMNELKSRGVRDVLIAARDGLKGFPEAITAGFPQVTVQTCTRASSSWDIAAQCPAGQRRHHFLNFCAWKDRKAVAADLRLIYRAATADLAAAELDAFEEKGPGNTPRWLRHGGGRGRK